MSVDKERLAEITRRHFFRRTGFGIGSVALASLLDERLLAQAPSDPLLPRPPHHPPKAKSVIHLFMAGAPSQIDLFDPKPRLAELDGEPCPEEFLKGERFAFIKGVPRLLGSPYAFARRGGSGAEISELLPRLAEVADRLAFVRSLRTDEFNHAPAQIFMNTGHGRAGRPSMGAWLTYGLGSEGRDLPGFVVLVSGDARPDGGNSCWGCGFLPSVYQGVEFRSSGDPVLFLSDPRGVDSVSRRRALDAIAALNRLRREATADPEIETRIASYEMAYRMQTSVPDLMDLSKEPPEVHALYGTSPGKPSFANNCLLARRLVERGVRFVELFHRGWDHHGEAKATSITDGLPRLCRETDQGAAALVADLARTGLLDSTLVVWGGEFGRTPMNEARGGSKFLGRDHHPRAFTMWLAGAGVKPGITIGTTDELGYNPVEDPVHVNDLHATILHLLGLEHTRLTYRSEGRDFRLTDVAGEVVGKLLA
ncbi:MAG: DUF1501 domain-containing protein [Planctomycetota bacterium]